MRRPNSNAYLPEEVLTDALDMRGHSDPRRGLTRRPPLAIDRADNYTDLYNMPHEGTHETR